nr:MAG TPA: hypothetical protein [Caudoviricetes sp.]
MILVLSLEIGFFNFLGRSIFILGFNNPETKRKEP